MIRHRFLAGLVFTMASCAGSAWGHAQAAKSAPADASPGVTAPWATSGAVGPAFSPDGNTVVIARGHATARRLYVSHRRAGKWSQPERAPFSNRWMDIEPALAPDGSYLVFVSNRPATPGGKPLAGFFNGKLHPDRGGNLWRVDHSGGSWGTPVRLPGVVNAGTSVYSPTVAADGSIYFTLPDPHTRLTRIYVSHHVAGHYDAPRPVSFSNGVNSDFDPVVAPDQSFIVFGSNRPPTPRNHGELFVVFAQPHGWGTPIPMNVYGYEARLAPDRRSVYFTADSDGRIHRVSLSRWLARHAAGARR